MKGFGVRDNVDYEPAHSFASSVLLSKLINLSERDFALLNGVAVSIQMVHVKRLAYSRCQISGVANMVQHRKPFIWERGLSHVAKNK